ncbi:MAG: glycosyltransferase [Lachnospiraceae bacterium]|nr:glycosyltransferase [Lachnospiraceae bacterium]
MDQPIVSIIIPVYNKSRYLRKCLDSLVGQSVTDIEIICVNDASTDDSIIILKDYARRDDRVHIIENEVNRGAACSRNRGMETATGKYLIFLDADDYFSENLVEKTVCASEHVGADIVTFDFAEEDDKNGDIMYPRQRWWIVDAIRNNKGVLPDDLYPWFFLTNSPATWNKLYLRSFIERIGAKFQQISSSNDVFFSNYAMLMADRITYVTSEEPLLFYRTNVDNQIISNIDRDPLAVFQAMDETQRIIKEIPKISERQISFIDRVPVNLLHAFRKLRTNEGVARFTAYSLSECGIKKYGLWGAGRDSFLSGAGYRAYIELLEELGCFEEMKSTKLRSEDQLWFNASFFMELKKLNKRCAVWGYGKYGRRFCETATDHGYGIVGILDQNRGIYDGKIVSGLEDFDWDTIDMVILMIRDKHKHIKEALREIRSYKAECLLLDAITWMEWRVPLHYCMIW